MRTVQVAHQPAGEGSSNRGSVLIPATDHNQLAEGLREHLKVGTTISLPAGKSDLVPKEPPPGWVREVRARGGAHAGGTYSVFWGPNGEQSKSIKAAWQMHAPARKDALQMYAEDEAAPSEPNAAAAITGGDADGGDADGGDAGGGARGAGVPDKGQVKDGGGDATEGGGNTTEEESTDGEEAVPDGGARGGGAADGGAYGDGSARGDGTAAGSARGDGGAAAATAEYDSEDEDELASASLRAYVEACGGAVTLVDGWRGYLDRRGRRFFVADSGTVFLDRAAVARHLGLEPLSRGGSQALLSRVAKELEAKELEAKELEAKEPEAKELEAKEPEGGPPAVDFDSAAHDQLVERFMQFRGATSMTLGQVAKAIRASSGGVLSMWAMPKGDRSLSLLQMQELDEKIGEYIDRPSTKALLTAGSTSKATNCRCLVCGVVCGNAGSLDSHMKAHARRGELAPPPPLTLVSLELSLTCGADGSVSVSAAACAASRPPLLCEVVKFQRGGGVCQNSAPHTTSAGTPSASRGPSTSGARCGSLMAPAPPLPADPSDVAAVRACRHYMEAHMHMHMHMHEAGGREAALAGLIGLPSHATRHGARSRLLHLWLEGRCNSSDKQRVGCKLWLYFLCVGATEAAWAVGVTVGAARTWGAVAAGAAASAAVNAASTDVEHDSEQAPSATTRAALKEHVLSEGLTHLVAGVCNGGGNQHTRAPSCSSWRLSQWLANLAPLEAYQSVGDFLERFQNGWRARRPQPHMRVAVSGDDKHASSADHSVPTTTVVVRAELASSAAGVTLQLVLHPGVALSTLDARLDVLRAANACGWWGISHVSATNCWVVQLLTFLEHKVARLASLQAAVLELVRRYKDAFNMQIFGTDSEGTVVVEREVRRVPYVQLQMDRDLGYVAHATECALQPDHICRLASGHVVPGLPQPPLSRTAEPAHTTAGKGLHGPRAATSSAASGALGPGTSGPGASASAAGHTCTSVRGQADCSAGIAGGSSAWAAGTGRCSGAGTSGSMQPPPDRHREDLAVARPRPANKTTRRAAPSLLNGFDDTAVKRARVGAEFQVGALPQCGAKCAMRRMGSRDSPPRCRCAAGANRLPPEAVWRLGRWWCAAMDDNGDGGCGFEYLWRPEVGPAVESLAWAPECQCRRVASWSRGRFWVCDAGVCDFVYQPAALLLPQPAEPTFIARKQCAQEAAQGTAAFLTAAAYGPVEPFCFASPRSDAGVGLFARSRLQNGQFVTEYGGPRLPARLQTRGQ